MQYEIDWRQRNQTLYYSEIANEGKSNSKSKTKHCSLTQIIFCNIHHHHNKNTKRNATKNNICVKVKSIHMIHTNRAIITKIATMPKKA